jgi:hypothetical protein
MEDPAVDGLKEQEKTYHTVLSLYALHSSLIKCVGGCWDGTLHGCCNICSGFAGSVVKCVSGSYWLSAITLASILNLYKHITYKASSFPMQLECTAYKCTVKNANTL